MDKNNRNESSFIKNYPLIFTKYRPIKKIGSGAFSEVYSGINIYTKEKVAIKIEKRNQKYKYLDTECYFLYSLKGLGIPKVLSFGHNKEYDILIMPLLGKTLQEIYISKKGNFEIKDICLMAIQIIERIHWIHSNKIIHRDIKPDNFMIGIKDPNIIYLIDFGLCKKYRSSQTGRHIKFGDVRKFTGNIRYGSVNSLKLKEQSRRDDLESIGYMLIYFMKGRLPWMGSKVSNKKENYFKVAKFKNSIEPEKLCENLPTEFVDYMKYVKNLKFEENPDYHYLINLFEKILKKRGIEEEYCYFSWINQNSIIARKIKPIVLQKRLSGSREKIFNKIRKSLDIKRSLSEFKKRNNNNNHIFYTDNKIENKNSKDKIVNNNIILKNKFNNNYQIIKNLNVNNLSNNNFINISISLQNNINLNIKNPKNQTFLNNKNYESYKYLEAFSEKASIINLNKRKFNNNNIIYLDKNIINKSKKYSPSRFQYNNNLNKNIDVNRSENSNSFKNIKPLYKKVNNSNNNCVLNTSYIYYNKISNKNKDSISSEIKKNNTKIITSYSQKYKAENKNIINLFNSNNFSSSSLKEKKDINKDNEAYTAYANKTKNLKNKKLFKVSASPQKLNEEKYKNNRCCNNELMNELKKFNLRYNNNIFLNDSDLIKNKIKKNAYPKSIQINQSAEQNRFNILKNYRTKYKTTNNDSNCNIF